MNADDVRHQLELILNEFYQPITSNERKREIEVYLASLRTAPQAWELCQYFIQNSSDHYVVMFSLGVLESLAPFQWKRLTKAQQIQTCTLFTNHIATAGHLQPRFICNKFCKLYVVLMAEGTTDDSMQAFSLVESLMNSKHTRITGLMLYNIMCEDLFTLQRNHEIRATAQLTIRTKGSTLAKQLAAILVETFVNANDKCHGDSTSGVDYSVELFQAVENCLRCSEINELNSNLIKILFHLSNPNAYSKELDTVCIPALSVITSILYRKNIGTPNTALHTQMFVFSLELLRLVAATSCDQIDARYLEKLCEFLSLQIEQNFPVLDEMYDQLKTIEILSLMYQLCVQLDSIPCYLACLSVWKQFLKTYRKCRNALDRYAEPIIGILDLVVRKIQHKSNARQLAQINNCDLDENNETDWHIFVRENIELIALIAEYIPLRALQITADSWNASYAIYTQLPALIDTSSMSLSCSRQDTDQLGPIMRDMATLTQCLARLSPILFDSDAIAANNADNVREMIDKFIQAANLASKHQLHLLHVPVSSLNQCFVDNFSELVAAIQMYLIWLNRLEKISASNIAPLFDIILPQLRRTDTPSQIRYSASRLLHVLSSILLANKCNIEELLGCCPALMEYLTLAPTLFDRTTQQHRDASQSHQSAATVSNTDSHICSTVVVLLLKCHSTSPDHCDTLLRQFMHHLIEDFCQLDCSTQEGTQALLERCQRRTLPFLTCIVELASDCAVINKKRLLAHIESVIHHVVAELPKCVQITTIAEPILEFMLAVFRVLHQQMGVDATHHIIQVFYDIATKGHDAINLIKKLLQIFQIVIEVPGNTYKSFIDGILDFCLNQVFQNVIKKEQQQHYVENFVALLRLLHSILLYKWQHFSTTSRISNNKRMTASTSEHSPAGDFSPQLVAIVAVFGQGLLQTDATIFQLALQYLENLNSKWHLYTKVLYNHNNLLGTFVGFLIKARVSKSHDMLTDEIDSAIYNMASVDFDYFWTKCVPDVLNAAKLSPEVRQELFNRFSNACHQDMPSFVLMLNEFVREMNLAISAFQLT